MWELERRRAATLERLGDAYARGQLATETLEQRLELAVAAAEPQALSATLLGLPGRRAPRWAQLRLGGMLLQPCAERSAWVVGRSSSCDVQLLDPAVSARHARVTCRGGRWAIVDLHSTNGTWVNGVCVDHAVLVPGDELVLGDLVGALAT